jgi:hypothetical protein
MLASLKMLFFRFILENFAQLPWGANNWQDETIEAPLTSVSPGQDQKDRQ